MYYLTNTLLHSFFSQSKISIDEIMYTEYLTWSQSEYSEKNASYFNYIICTEKNIKCLICACHYLSYIISLSFYSYMKSLSAENNYISIWILSTCFYILYPSKLDQILSLFCSYSKNYLVLGYALILSYPMSYF